MIYTHPTRTSSASVSIAISASTAPSTSSEPAIYVAAAASQTPSTSPSISAATIEYCLDYANTTCQASCGNGTAEVEGSFVCDLKEEKCCEPFEAEKCTDPYFKCGAAGSCNGKVVTGYVGCDGATPECCEFEECITEGGTCKATCNAHEEGTADYPCDVLGGICCFPKYEEETA